MHFNKHLYLSLKRGRCSLNSHLFNIAVFFPVSLLVSLPFFPYAGRKQKQHRENLKPSQEHFETQRQLGKH